MAKLASYVQLLALDTTTTSTTYVESVNMFPYTWTASAYDGTITAYFEVILKTNNASGTAYAKLYDKTGSAEITGTEVSTSSTSYVRLRSSSFTPADGEEYTCILKSNSASYTTGCVSATLVIVQSGTITKKRTCIVIHRVNSTQSTDWANVAGTAWNTYTHTASRWDGITACYYETRTKHATAGETSSDRMFDGTTGYGEVSTTSTTFVTLRSSSFTLTDGANYRGQQKSTHASNATSSGRLIIDQSSFTKTVSLYQPGVSGGTSTSTTLAATNFWYYHDNDEWTDSTVTIYVSAGNLSVSSAATGTLTLQSGGSDIGTVTSTSTTIYTWVEATFSPSDNQELQAFVKTSTAVASVVYRTPAIMYVATIPVSGKPTHFLHYARQRTQ